MVALSGSLATLGADLVPLPPAPDLSASPAHTVLRIEDETPVVFVDGAELKVALLGVRWPKKADDLAAARTFLENLLLGESVHLSLQSDEAGAATAALVYRAPDGLFVNLELIRQGYASSAPRPSNELRDVFRAHERRAKQAGRGQWSRNSRRLGGAASGGAEAGQAQEAKQDAAQQAAALGLVYVTKSGTKYHVEGCPHLRKSAIPISLQEAVKRYQPCSHCKPPAPD